VVALKEKSRGDEFHEEYLASLHGLVQTLKFVSCRTLGECIHLVADKHDEMSVAASTEKSRGDEVHAEYLTSLHGPAKTRKSVVSCRIWGECMHLAVDRPDKMSMVALTEKYHGDEFHAEYLASLHDLA